MCNPSNLWVSVNEKASIPQHQFRFCIFGRYYSQLEIVFSKDNSNLLQRIADLQAREWYREDLTGVAITESRVSRDQLFLTSKLHPRDLGQVASGRGLHKELLSDSSGSWQCLPAELLCLQVSSKIADSLHDLNTTYLDLFLLHYPR